MFLVQEDECIKLHFKFEHETWYSRKHWVSLEMKVKEFLEIFYISQKFYEKGDAEYYQAIF